MTVLRLLGQRSLCYNKNYSICPVRPKQSNGLGKWSFLFGAIMKEIRLTKGKIAKVDDWMYDELSKYKWHAKWNKMSFYAARVERGKTLFRKTIFMHRQIMNTPDGVLCDHRDHDTLNNQGYNLRNATHSQNSMNRRTRFDNKLKEKCIQPYGLGFLVRIKMNGKYVFSESYSTLEDAIVARDEALRKYHGDFAYFPENDVEPQAIHSIGESNG